MPPRMQPAGDSNKSPYAMNEAELEAVELFLEARVSRGEATGYDVSRLTEISGYLRSFHEAKDRIRQREAANADPDAP